MTLGESHSDAPADAARELGCPDDADALDRALKKGASAPPPKSVKKRKTKSPRAK